MQGFAQKRWFAHLRVLLLGWALVLFAVPAWCADQIALITPETPSSLLAEATIRVAAELRAAGFVVVEHDASGWDSADSDVFVGRVELSETGPRIHIVTSARQEGGALQQEADPSDPLTTAEVIAVRAVESLRAVLLQAVRNRTLQNEDLTPAVQTFTGQDAPPKPIPRPRLPKPATPPSRPPPPAEKDPKELGALLGLSPSFVSLGTDGAFSGALEARGLLNFGGPTIGMIVEGSVIPYQRKDSDGRLSVHHISILLRPGWAFVSARKALEFHLGFCAGLDRLYFNAKANPNIGSASGHHNGLLLQGDISLARFWENGFGAQAYGRFGALLNVPTFEGTSTLETLGRPLISLGVGVVYRFPKSSGR